jgi:hypothetical protein
MSSNLPVDILPMILKNLDKADLTAMCLVNKVCCSLSQDILYRNIEIYHHTRFQVCRTLAYSTHLARRVRSFRVIFRQSIESNEVDNLATALRNMSSLRILVLYLDDRNPNILDGCTFKLDSFSSNLYCDEYFLKFLNGQPSLTHVEMPNFARFKLHTIYDRSPTFDATFLPNLTRISAQVAWLRCLIPGRPVSEVDVSGYFVIDRDYIDWNFFTLSTTPIRKLTTSQHFICSKPAELLASIFPSLVHLSISMVPDLCNIDVRKPFF